MEDLAIDLGDAAVAGDLHTHVDELRAQSFFGRGRVPDRPTVEVTKA